MSWVIMIHSRRSEVPSSGPTFCRVDDSTILPLSPPISTRSNGALRERAAIGRAGTFGVGYAVARLLRPEATITACSPAASLALNCGHGPLSSAPVPWYPIQSSPS